MMMLKITNRSWKPTIQPEEIGGKTVYFACHPALDGVVAQGDTEEEARTRFNENLNRYKAHLASKGLPMPVAPTHTDFKIKLDFKRDSKVQSSQTDNAPELTAVCVR
ncbi:MAG: type II toxin-antitoxin system HicB family antitoxin [Fimbriimonadaceae bacterium]